VIDDVLRQYTRTDLKAACQQYMAIPRNMRTRAEIYTVISQAPPDIQAGIRSSLHHSVLISSRLMTGDSTATLDVPASRDTQEPENNHSLSDSEEIIGRLCTNAFMRTPTEDVIDAAVAGFIDRTNNAALAVGICGVCARETAATDLNPHLLDHIPSRHRLTPSEPHAKHDIYDGMLLHPSGLSRGGLCDICCECLRALKADKVPKFALANGMWIGQTPHELQFLTLPERMLVAKFFPAAYIIKLYPKKKGARFWDKCQMYSGLRGNVSTYRLDQSQITSMIDGSAMPHTTDILAATIGITFVGPRNLPDRGLPDMFKVRRARVKKALEWLKDNNPLFKDITISTSRLAQIPEDGVPYELTVTTKHSTDVNMLYAEQDGYVPLQEAEENDDGGMPLVLLLKQLH
jgi:hypothetical protein